MEKPAVPLRILMIGAHPDDCETCAGGYAALMAQKGHQVCMMSLTDGSLGHYQHPPAQLVAIRHRESHSAAALIGAESVILPNQDGCLCADLETRKMVIRAVRGYRPDVILTHRSNDYHADHRNASLLVQDASYMLRLPGVCPEAQPLDKLPYILFFHDNFQNPPFQPDVVISIDSVYDTKVRMKAAHVSQYFEWLPWLDHRLDQVPDDPEERIQWLRKPRLDDPGEGIGSIRQSRGDKGQYATTLMYREFLLKRYGARGEQVVFSEAFSFSEYGAPGDDEAIERLFPGI